MKNKKWSDVETLDYVVGRRAYELFKTNEGQVDRDQLLASCMDQAVSETLNRYHAGEIKILPLGNLTRSRAGIVGEILGRLNTNPSSVQDDEDDMQCLLENTYLEPTN